MLASLDIFLKLTWVGGQYDNSVGSHLLPASQCFNWLMAPATIVTMALESSYLLLLPISC